jgi:hypothetical protein
MRDSRERWTFIKHKSKEPISTAEVLYWKSFLAKVLKIGIEYEYNLPDQKGTCRGDSKACPCTFMLKKDCWMGCRNEEFCFSKPRYELCISKAINCDPSDCENCKHFAAECHGIYCSNFVSACFGCPTFTRDCENCSNRFDKNRNPEHIRKVIESELGQTQNYGVINKTGVHSIETDGSLLGKKGVEIITVGRRLNYWEFFNMSRKIIDCATMKGAYLNERCSTHMHILASYYGKLPSSGRETGIPSQISEMEKDMPEIILANFHQLCRRYQNAITWMTMALDEPERMTRWEKFRVSVLTISAVRNTMNAVKDMVSQNAGGNKYGWVNYNKIQFSENGNIKRFHVEMRTADGMNSPSAIAAMACLYYALVIKAVEISRYGVVEVGDSQWIEKSVEMKEAMMNNMKDYGAGDRFSDTSNLYKYYDILRGESFDLIKQLKHILIKIGPAYQVLEKLADMPVALRRCNGDDWEAIETDLAVYMNEQSQLEIKLGEYIDLRLIDQCTNMEEWIEMVGQALREDPELNITKEEEVMENIKEYVENKKNNGELIWSDSLGAVVLL